MIIYQSANIQGVFKMDTLQETGIPAVLVGNASGTTLKNYAADTPNGNVTLDPAIYETQTNEFDTIAFFSSRGPSIRQNAIKPEMVAVGYRPIPPNPEVRPEWQHVRSQRIYNGARN